MSGPTEDNHLINYLVRMVVPLRREFGRQLNVQQFMHDFAYAREVLDQAKTSTDPRLVEYASYVEGRSRSPRIADKPSASEPRADDTATEPPPSAVPAAPATTPRSTAAAAPPSAPSAQELRDRVLKKYTTGLR
jgi:hypothetical protein